MKLVPVSTFAPPDLCPARNDGKHVFRRRAVTDDDQPFVVQALVCDFCRWIHPVNDLRDEPAAWVRKYNERIINPPNG